MRAAVVRWLRTDRWFCDEFRACQSRHQYGLVEGRPPPDRYGTSILGVINGYLPIFRLVLVAHIDGETQKPVPPFLSFRRKWW